MRTSARRFRLPSLHRPAHLQSSQLAPISALHSYHPSPASPAPPGTTTPASSHIHLRRLATSASTSASPASPAEHCDAVILGGGVVGLALAAALVSSPQLQASASLTGSPLRLILLDAADLTRLTTWAKAKNSASGEVDWENRVVSLTADNWNWLRDIGVTPHLVQHRVHPVTSMHVTDGLTGAAIDLGESSGSSAHSSSSTQPLSYMVELTNLQQALLQYIYSRSAQANTGVKVDVLQKSKVLDIAPHLPDQHAAADQYQDAWPMITTIPATPPPDSHSQTQTQTQTRIRPRLLIGADGPSSPVRKYAGIEKYGWPYHRKGLVGTLRFDSAQSKSSDSTAYQRFLKTGTIAWLPLSSSAASTVWALPPDLANSITALHRSQQPSIMADLINASWRLPWSSLATILTLVPTEPTPAAIDTLRHQIRAHLQAADAEGTLIPEEDCPPLVKDVDSHSVASFPLSVAHTECYLGSSLQAPSATTTTSSLLQSAMSLTGFWSAEQTPQKQPHGRTVLVGDAAHTIHPLAGQGLNLGLADVQSLTRTLSDAAKVGADWGSHDALKAYERERYIPNQAMLSAVDHLFWLFNIGGETLQEAQRRGGAPQTPPPGLLRSPASFLADATVWARSTGIEVLNELDWIKSRIQKSAGSRS